MLMTPDSFTAGLSCSSLRGEKNAVTSPSTAATKAMANTRLMAFATATRAPSAMTASEPGTGSRRAATRLGSSPEALRFAASRALNAAPITLTPRVPPIERLNCRVEVAVPVLRKDFILEPIQIYESAALGADAMLLLCNVLDQGQLRALLLLTRSLGMEALVEVHTREELDAAVGSGAQSSLIP